MVDRICDNCMSRVPADSEKCPRCGIRFENSNPGGALPNGWVLGGRYTVGRYMEIDGEGVTYSAIDGNTLQRVTIKEFMPVTLCATRDEAGNIVPKPGNEVLFKTTRMDYRELYDTLLRMSLTEGLVQVLDVLEENNTAYAVIEKVEGPTLAEYMTKSAAPMEANRAMAVLRPVLMGVESMHSANLVHRGISPENIILESGGSAKLAGFATLALRQQGSELKPKLYPGYSAPEQYAASEFEGRYTDVYALGAVLYRMVTGNAPEPADERKMQDNLRPARQLNKEVPNFLSAAIGRALRLAPAERMQNISDLRLALTGEGGKEARGPLGLTKQQLIVGGVALGAVVVILIVILLVTLLGGNKDKDDSTSTLTTTSLVSSVASGVENPVPSFVNQTLAYVQGKYSVENGGEYTFTVEEAFSEAVDEGFIMSQDPEAGTEWDGGTIKLVVSKGPNPEENSADMPDFQTKKTDVEAAKKQLEELGIQYTVVTETNNGSYDEGQIIRTSPGPGTSVNFKTDKVVLYVADVKPVQMPNVIGLTLSQAETALKNAGIKYTTQWQYNDGSYTPMTVAKASVDTGASVQPSTTVTLYQASDYGVPNLVGMNVDAAIAELNAIDGRIAANGGNIRVTYRIEYRQTDGGSPGQVITQTPTYGNEFKNSVEFVLGVVGEDNG